MQTIDVNVYNLLNPPYFLTTGSSKGGTLTGGGNSSDPAAGSDGVAGIGGDRNAEAAQANVRG
ncbi:hypothetical protein Cst04h_17780 [Corynebacterium striatum]|uniref:Uncharacterized protein n=1 Tax=Corynebacterium striatum TaxID=43770 RepID=A0ABC9ZNR0_CORST|nr:hypothetical protein Cst04h_17780 [Corynebacterium striatum]